MDICTYYELITTINLVNDLSTPKVIMVLLTIFLMLFIASSWFVYFITILYLLMPLNYFGPTISLAFGDYMFAAYIDESVFICFVCFLDSTYM